MFRRIHEGLLESFANPVSPTERTERTLGHLRYIDLGYEPRRAITGDHIGHERRLAMGLGQLPRYPITAA